MDLRQAQQRLTSDLTAIYGQREAATIADWVMEHLTGQKKIDRLINPSIQLSDALLQKYDVYRSELLAHRPVQYVLHESWFAGLRFYVDEHVLIPRPETEELVGWAAGTMAVGAAGAILDVGTGSGCIAIVLAAKLPTWPVHACDISAGALGVARRNATDLHAPVHFHLLDFLDSSRWSELPPVLWLISNPPYIPLGEKATMPRHVADAEPSRALFVPDADPLVFYRALACFARRQLLPGGAVFVETHEGLAADAADLFKAAGLQEVLIRKDMQGKDRMIQASLYPGP